jgi:outer membrane protein, heavy metal efflux system
MFTLSQQFYFPGKRAIKGEMAARDADSLRAVYEGARHRVAARIKSIYYDLFLAHRTIDVLQDRTGLFSRIEDAASSRYASGMGTQQEVLMAQTEKYMIMEKEEMQRQRVEALQGMLNVAVGRDANSPLGRPATPAPTRFGLTLDEAVAMAKDHSPDVISKKKMVEGAEAKIRMAKKEYYPDFAIGAGYFQRGGGTFPPMWNLTATVNLPIFYKSKQRQAVLEANSGLSEAKREQTATELMVSSNVREAYSMLRASERLMRLYDEGVIRKASQDVQLAFSGYATGKADALTVITRIQNLLNYEILYWNQFVEREKAIARLHEFVGSEEAARGSEGETR